MKLSCGIGRVDHKLGHTINYISCQSYFKELRFKVISSSTSIEKYHWHDKTDVQSQFFLWFAIVSTRCDEKKILKRIKSQHLSCFITLQQPNENNCNFIQFLPLSILSNLDFHRFIGDREPSSKCPTFISLSNDFNRVLNPQKKIDGRIKD